MNPVGVQQLFLRLLQVIADQGGHAVAHAVLCDAFQAGLEFQIEPYGHVTHEAGLVVRPSPPRLAKRFFLSGGDPHVHPMCNFVVRQNLVDRFLHLGFRPPTRPRGGQAQFQRVQFLHGPFQRDRACQCVDVGFPRAVVPDQAIAVAGRADRCGERELVLDLSRLVLSGLQRAPLNLAALEQFTKRPVFLSRAGQHAHESLVSLMYVSHVLQRCELRIEDIQEIASPAEDAEHVPRGLVGLIIDRVAAFDAELDRHRSDAGDREQVEHLLEIRPMIIVVSPGRWREPAHSAATQLSGLPRRPRGT